MEITNKHNLPEFLVRAIEASGKEYSKNTKYSVTQLLKSARAASLMRRHFSDLQSDISENLWQFLGSAVHAFTEKGEGKNDLTEERLTYKTVSGQIDFYDGEEKILYDVKVSSIWSVIYASSKIDWQKQLSIYAFLLKNAGFEVKKIVNIVFCRDWQKRDFIQGKHNLEIPVQAIEHDLLTEIDGQTIDKWLDARIAELDQLEMLSDDDLPLCEKDYRWSESGKYKIFWNESKASTQTSKKNFDESEKEAAEKYLKELNVDPKKTYRLEYVAGNPYKRCEYCQVNAFCNQFQKRL